MKTNVLSLMMTIGALAFFNSQESNRAFAILMETKSSIESKISDLPRSYSVDSKIYFDRYQKYKDLYYKMLPKYQGYRGDLIYCGVSENSKKGFKSCMKLGVENFASPLSDLDRFYREMNPIRVPETIDILKRETRNIVPSTTTTIDPFTIAITAMLVDGGIKAWRYLDDKTLAQIERIRSEISKPEYDLKELKDILPPPTYVDLTKE